MPTVLIVDDDPGTLESFEAILSRHGSVPILASTGLQGLGYLRSLSLGLAVIDMRLPDIGGLEVLRQARAEGIDVPCVMVTGFGLDHSAIDAMKLGAAEFLEKPVFVEDLLRLVDEHARLHPVPVPPVRAPGNIHAIRALQIIERDYADPNLSADQVACRLGISREHLSRSLEPTGASFGAHLRRTRISRAKVLLETGRTPLIDIVTAVGYRTVKGLSDNFRRATGISPRDHRRTQDRLPDQSTRERS